MAETGAPKPKVHLNKWWIIGGGVAGVAVYVIYKRKAASSATTATADTSTTDSSIDPATGVPYADETDYTSGSPYSALSGLTYDAQTGQYEVAASTSTASTVPSDNQSWAKEITNYLVGQGYDQTSTENAISSYLENNGQALTSGQTSIVQAALAYGGTPPVAVPTQLYTGNAGQSSAIADGLYKLVGGGNNGTVVQVTDGKRSTVSGTTYAEEGNPTPTAVNVGTSQYNAVTGLAEVTPGKQI